MMQYCLGCAMSVYETELAKHFDEVYFKAILKASRGTPCAKDDYTMLKTLYYDRKDPLVVEFVKTIKPYPTVHDFLRDYPLNEQTISQSIAENRPLDESMIESSIYCNNCGGKMIMKGESVERGLDEQQPDKYLCLRKGCKNPRPRKD
jgi:hypothetical protein